MRLDSRCRPDAVHGRVEDDCFPRNAADERPRRHDTRGLVHQRPLHARLLEVLHRRTAPEPCLIDCAIQGSHDGGHSAVGRAETGARSGAAEIEEARGVDEEARRGDEAHRRAPLPDDPEIGGRPAAQGREPD